MRYEVSDIRNEPFYHPETGEKLSDKTCQVSVIEENVEANILLYDCSIPSMIIGDNIIRMGFLEADEIYKKIGNEEDIILDGCFIVGFNIEYDRVYKKLSKGKSIKNFSAKCAIFRPDESGEISFSNVKFENGNIDFTYAHFEDGDKNFKDMIMGRGEVNFSNAYFGNGDVDFRNTIFGEGDVCFSGVQFRNGNVFFSNAQFGEGDVVFFCAQFGVGDVDFVGTRFGEGYVGFQEALFGEGYVGFDTV